MISSVDQDDFGRHNVGKPIRQGLLYCRTVTRNGKPVAFSKQKLVFVIVTVRGVFVFDYHKPECERSKCYALTSEAELRIVDESNVQEQVFAIVVSSKMSYFEFECFNFTEKDAWKKALEKMQQEAAEHGTALRAVEGAGADGGPPQRIRRDSHLTQHHPTTSGTMSPSALQAAVAAAHEMKAVVTVTLQEAKGLARMDLIGNSDPYVKIIVENRVQTSTTKANTLAPQWQESFSFETTTLPCDVLLVMYDHDRVGSDDIMGYVPIQVPSAGERSDTNSEWYDLRSTELGEKAQGKVCLSFRCRYDALTQQRVVFGVRLSELMSRDHHRDAVVPDVAFKCLRLLDLSGTEARGIFRVPGSHDRMAEYARRFDSGDHSCDFPFSEDVHLVASMLKLLLRDMPEPVICYSAYNDLVAAVTRTSGAREAVDRIRRVLREQLPAENQRLLRLVCCLLKKITVNSEATLMKVSNIAIVFSAVLISAPPELQTKKAEVLQHLPVLNSIVEYLIKYFHQIFDVKRNEDPLKQLIMCDNKLSALLQQQQQQQAQAQGAEQPGASPSSAGTTPASDDGIGGEEPFEGEEAPQSPAQSAASSSGSGSDSVPAVASPTATKAAVPAFSYADAVKRGVNWAVIEKVAQDKISRDNQEVQHPELLLLSPRSAASASAAAAAAAASSGSGTSTPRAGSAPGSGSNTPSRSLSPRNNAA